MLGVERDTLCIKRVKNDIPHSWQLNAISSTLLIPI